MINSFSGVAICTVPGLLGCSIVSHKIILNPFPPWADVIQSVNDMCVCSVLSGPPVWDYQPVIRIDMILKYVLLWIECDQRIL